MTLRRDLMSSLSLLFSVMLMDYVGESQYNFLFSWHTPDSRKGASELIENLKISYSDAIICLQKQQKVNNFRLLNLNEWKNYISSSEGQKIFVREFETNVTFEHSHKNDAGSKIVHRRMLLPSFDRRRLFLEINEMQQEWSEKLNKKREASSVLKILNIYYAAMEETWIDISQKENNSSLNSSGIKT